MAKRARLIPVSKPKKPIRRPPPRRPQCRHCRRRSCQIRQRGLCRRCYYDLSIRRLYPQRLHGRHDGGWGRSRFANDRPEPVPTDAEPGSAAKVEVLRQRYAAGQQLHSDRDATVNRSGGVDLG